MFCNMLFLFLFFETGFHCVVVSQAPGLQTRASTSRWSVTFLTLRSTHPLCETEAQLPFQYHVQQRHKCYIAINTKIQFKS